MKSNKAFTIIELVVVIAVIGILVLLASVKYSDYTEKAKITQVKNDIMTYEKEIDSKLHENDKYVDSWEKVDLATISSLKRSMFNKKGLIWKENQEKLSDDFYYKIPKTKNGDIFDSSLKGDFYLSQGGKVYYSDKKLASDVSGGESDKEIEMHTVVFNNYYGNPLEEKKVEDGGAVEPPKLEVKGYKLNGWDKELENVKEDLLVDPVFEEPTDKSLGVEEDYKWVKDSNGYIGLNGEKGFFKYVGVGKKEVEIPHIIQGVQITSYYRMFEYAPSELEKVVSSNRKLTSTKRMFYYSNSKSLNFADFYTSSIKDMSYMFYGVKGEVSGLNNFNTSNVTDMSFMFSHSYSDTLDLRSFNTSSVVNFTSMFRESKTTNIFIDTDKFDTSNATSMGGMFWGTQVTNLDVSKFNTSKVTSMNSMFQESEATNLDVSNFDTSNVTDMTQMFWGSKSKTLDVSNFNTSKVKGMAFMFSVTSATNIDVSNFDTSKVENMSQMFSHSKAIEIDVSNFNTSNVVDMNNMFYMADTEVIDVSNFDTSKVTDMRAMFGDTKAKSLNVSNFNTSNVKNMSNMFASSLATTLDLSNFNTSKVTDMNNMFSNSQVRELNLNSFNTSNVKNMDSMFYNSKIKTLDLSSFDTSNVSSLNWMFRSSNSTIGYAKTQADADKFNSSSSKPAGLNFILK